MHTSLNDKAALPLFQTIMSDTMQTKTKYFNTIEIVFIASMIGLDFAFGLIVRPFLNPTGILEFVRIDMIVPLMMMFTTRLVVDKFGTLILYELIWGILAVAAMPASFGIPGFFKLIPALTYGIILDTCMQIFKDKNYIRLLIAGILGGFVNQCALLGIKLLFGMPLSSFVKILFGVNLFTIFIINIIAIHLTLSVWKGLERSGWIKRIHTWRTS